MEDDIDNSFLCPICLDYPNYPCVLLTCKHVFCYNCIKINKNHKCPLCNKKYQDQDIFLLSYGKTEGKCPQVKNNKLNVKKQDSHRKEKLRKIKKYTQKTIYYINPFTYLNWFIAETNETILNTQRLIRQHKVQKQINENKNQQQKAND